MLRRALLPSLLACTALACTARPSSLPYADAGRAGAGGACSRDSHCGEGLRCLAFTCGEPPDASTLIDASVPDSGPGRPDAAMPPDAGQPDSGAPDAGRPDAAVTDGGGLDGGRSDAAATDGALPDAAATDAALPDASRDGGAPDAA